MKTDIEIAQEAKMKPITQIAAQLGLEDESVIPYGRYKAKIDHRLIHNAKKQGKLILVTAISPTPAGEGKTTTSVGLADAMNALGKKTMLCLREPSLGPVFGVKGGAAGGGYAQVVPMEDINLHFTGDLHAIGTANNLLAAMIDNSIQQGNPLNIDPRRITWKRCMDMNDRQLRFIVDGLGGKVNGTPREDGFDITVASEVMAIFCLATSISDLKERLSRIVCAYTYDGKPVTAGEIGAAARGGLLEDLHDVVYLQEVRVRNGNGNQDRKQDDVERVVKQELAHTALLDLSVLHIPFSSVYTYFAASVRIVSCSPWTPPKSLPRSTMPAMRPLDMTSMRSQMPINSGISLETMITPLPSSASWRMS